MMIYDDPWFPNSVWEPAFETPFCRTCFRVMPGRETEFPEMRTQTEFGNEMRVFFAPVVQPFQGRREKRRFTQGALAALATLGFGMQRRWR